MLEKRQRKKGPQKEPIKQKTKKAHKRKSPIDIPATTKK
jgi:hypothetical protein